MRKILVTGGAGFVGSALCKRLAEDKTNKVYSLDNYFTGKKENHHEGVKYFEGHTRDIATIFKDYNFDLVYHLGEYSRVEKSFEDPVSLLWDLNIAGTFAVLEFCKIKKSKIVYAGSSTKFASDGDGGNMSPYAWTKSSNTVLVKNFATWYGLDFAITYFYNVYGEGEISSGPYSTIIGIFKKQYEKSLPLTVVKPGDQKRNFTHISDIVSALLIVGENGNGDEYGIGSDEAYSISEVAAMFQDDFIWMPERRGNRSGAEVMSENTKSLGWIPKISLQSHINNYKLKTKVSGNIKKKNILLYATTFYPTEGYCEKAIRLLASEVPDINFHIITTNIMTGTDDLNQSNIHVYRIGEGKNIDKLSLMWNGHKMGLELAEKINFAFVWSVMGSYGTLPALRIKYKLKLPLLITLGDQKIKGVLNVKYWLLRLFSNMSDQISTNSALEVESNRSSNLEWLKNINKNGNVFVNAFRFAYNVIFTNIVKSNK